MQNSDGAFQGHKGNQASVAAQIYLILTSVVKYILSSHSGKLHSFTQGRIWKECKAYRVCRFQATQR